MRTPPPGCGGCEEPGMSEQTVDRGDVQGLVLRGYGTLRAARYVLAQVSDAGRARAWLAGLDVATGASGRGDVARNVAFTAAGLSALGVPGDAVAGFSHEFPEGMTSPHRTRRLGDTEESA